MNVLEDILNQLCQPSSIPGLCGYLRKYFTYQRGTAPGCSGPLGPATRRYCSRLGGGVAVELGVLRTSWARKESAPAGIRTTAGARPLPDSIPSCASRSKHSIAAMLRQGFELVETVDLATLGHCDSPARISLRSSSLRSENAPTGIRTLVIAVRGQYDWPDYTIGADVADRSSSPSRRRHQERGTGQI